MAKFRLQDLRIWQLAIEIANELFDIADELERKRLYRFADQLRGSGMSMSNNISEGSGSSSKKEFRRFLDIARRSTFENANIVILLEMRELITQVSYPLLKQMSLPQSVRWLNCNRTELTLPRKDRIRWLFLDSCFQRNDGRLACHVIPAQAGIQRGAKLEL